MMWADNRTKRRYLNATRPSVATYAPSCTCVEKCARVCVDAHVKNIYRYRRAYIYIVQYIKYRAYARDELLPAIYPSRSELSISIRYNDALVTVGCCGEPQDTYRRTGAKSEEGTRARARSCMKVTTALNGRKTIGQRSTDRNDQ